MSKPGDIFSIMKSGPGLSSAGSGELAFSKCASTNRVPTGNSPLAVVSVAFDALVMNSSESNRPEA